LIEKYPDDVKVPALEQILEKWEGDPGDVLWRLVDIKCPSLAKYLDASYAGWDEDVSGAAQAAGNEWINYMRMLLTVRKDHVEEDLAKNLGSIKDTSAQLRALGIVAMTGDAKYLPDAEKALANFAKVHRRQLEMTWEHTRAHRQAADGWEAEEFKPDFDAQARQDVFRMGLYLNMLGKDNAAELVDTFVKGDCTAPSSLDCPVVKDGKVEKGEKDARFVLNYIVKKDKDNKALPAMKKVAQDIMKCEWLFDETLPREKDFSKPPYPRLRLQPSWDTLLSVLMESGNKEVMTEAKALMEKHASHATNELSAVAKVMKNYDKKAVVAFLIAYLKVPVKHEDTSAWLDVIYLANEITGSKEDASPNLPAEKRQVTAKKLAEALEAVQARDK
jgi:hypothetical protein